MTAGHPVRRPRSTLRQVSASSEVTVPLPALSVTAPMPALSATAPMPAPPAAAPQRLRAALLAVAVAVAFADSAIVVLALPELLGEFNASIQGVAWVVTGFNLAVVVAALALLRGSAGRDPARVTRLGLWSSSPPRPAARWPRTCRSCSACGSSRASARRCSSGGRCPCWPACWATGGGRSGSGRSPGRWAPRSARPPAACSPRPSTGGPSSSPSSRRRRSACWPSRAGASRSMTATPARGRARSPPTSPWGWSRAPWWPRSSRPWCC